MVLSSVSARPNRVSASFVTGGRWITVAISSLLVLLVAGRPAAYAQLADSVRQQALNAFHGPDGQGKDGPLAPVGFDLALLHAQWQAHQAQHPDDPFEAPGSLPVAGGYVTVDATAAQDAKALRDSLEALGMTGIARARAVVSGRLPIRSIPAAAALANLRALRPARAMTHQAAPPSVAPSPPQPDTAPARSPVDTAAISDSTASTSPAPSLYWTGGVVFLIMGLLYFLLQRRF
jgi:hypothetical protein